MIVRILYIAQKHLCGIWFDIIRNHSSRDRCFLKKLGNNTNGVILDKFKSII